MYKNLKKLTAFLMALIFSITLLPSINLSAGQNDFQIKGTPTNGSVKISFASPESINYASLSLTHEINSVQSGNLIIDRVLNHDVNTNKDYEIFFRPIPVTTQKQVVKFTLNYPGSNTLTFGFDIEPENMQVISAANGSVVVEFPSARPLTTSDFTTKFYIENQDKGFVSVKTILIHPNYSNRYELTYNNFNQTTYDQNARVEIKFKDGNYITKDFIIPRTTSIDNAMKVISVENGSLILEINNTVGEVVTSSFETYLYIDGYTKGFLPISSVKTVSGYNNRFELSFAKVLTKSETQRIKIETRYRDNKYVTAEYDLYSNGSTSGSSNTNYWDTFRVVSAKNGSFIVEFEKSETTLITSDFTTNLYIDNYNKGYIPIRSISNVSGYNNRYELYFDKILTTSVTQKIKLETKYKDNAYKSIEFNLYNNGGTSENDIGSEYNDLKPVSFDITSIKNGEMSIRFKNPTKVYLDSTDFYAKYYLDGVYKGNLKFTDIDEDRIRVGTDYVLFFDKLESATAQQTVTVLVFYERETRTQPAKSIYILDKEEIVNEVLISMKEIKEFTSKLTLPTITIDEKGKNTILPTNKTLTEFIKLEAPEGFEWSLKVNLYGKDALKNATDYDLRYDKYRTEERRNVLLIGIINIDKDRTAKGSLMIDDLELRATSDTIGYGEVNIKISGAGIPYERFTVAKYVKNMTQTTPSPTPTPTPTPITPTPTPIEPEVPKISYLVSVTDGINEISVNGNLIPMDTSPFIQDNRTMLPVSHVAIAFGIPNTAQNINWDPSTRKVIIIDGDNIVELVIGSQILRVNGKVVIMDTAAIIKDNRTFIPIKYLADALDFKVDWNSQTRTAVLTKGI